MRRIITILLAVAALPLAAQEYGQNRTIEIWDNSTAPHSNGLATPETETEPNIIGSVTEAKLYIFEADPAKATGQSIVICPGGGYAVVCIGYEGVDMAKWLASQGITCGVLKYRMPNGHPDIPIKDALTAIETVRENAQRWHIDPEQVGIMGFSAGGHLASAASTHFTSDSNRPDFSILIYPVVTLDERTTHPGSRHNLIGREAPIGQVDLYSNEKQVDERTPCAFIALSDDDKGVPPANSLSYYGALKTFGIPAELHVYPSGGHGWGWRKSFRYHDELTAALERWLGEIRKQDRNR